MLAPRSGHIEGFDSLIQDLLSRNASKGRRRRNNFKQAGSILCAGEKTSNRKHGLKPCIEEMPLGNLEEQIHY